MLGLPSWASKGGIVNVVKWGTSSFSMATVSFATRKLILAAFTLLTSIEFLQGYCNGS